MSAAREPWSVAVAALRLATRLTDEIQVGVTAAGFSDVTPLHGFAFARVADGDATVAELAVHLAVSKQAAAQLTERLVRGGYVSRTPHPRDGRAQLLVLTPRGTQCMVAARAAAERAVAGWRDELGAGGVPAAGFEAALVALTAFVPGLRPPL